jgi:hypothetical protein
MTCGVTMIELGARRWALVCAGLLATACMDADEGPGSVRTAQQAVEGSPAEYSFARHQERVVLYLTNRARSQPEKYNPGSPYPVQPPLRYNRELSEAGRFHAQQIIEADCWCEDHSSCCEVGMQGGDLACTTASSGCGVMSAEARVTQWSAAYSGENMARGYPTGAAAIDGWISSPGHWKNINSAAHTMLGVGDFGGAWVQDFGRAGGAPPVAADGVHMDVDGQTRLGITYYQPGTGGPREIIAVVDGACHAMALEAGEPDHGAFEVSVSLEPGCHRYYFYVRDGAGVDHVWPEVGSFGASKGGGECAYWSENRPAESCTPAGQSCTTGDTRACYTGPFGTKGVGQCAAGVERCLAGAWQGECRLEVLPGEAEICDNAVDEDCDGALDNGCAVASEPDMGSAPDLGSSEPEPEPAQSGGGEDSGGCASGHGATGTLWQALVGCMGMAALKRRRRAVRVEKLPKQRETR